MEFTIDIKTFKQRLALFAPAARVNNRAAPYGGKTLMFLTTRHDGGLAAMTTDRFQLCVELGGINDVAGGTVTVDPIALATALKPFKSGTVRVVARDQTLAIGTGASEAMIICSPVDGPLPFSRDQLGDNILIQGRALARLLSSVEPMMSKDETRAHLHGCRLAMEGKWLVAVSTDGHRLTKALHFLTEGELRYNVTIPATAVRPLKAIAKAAARDDLRVEVAAHLDDDGTHHVRVAGAGYHLRTTTINRHYPPYNKVIPEKFNSKLEFDRRDLLNVASAAKAALPRADRSGCVWTFTDSGVDVSTHEAMTDVQFSARVNATYIARGDLVAIGMNPAYLADALKACPDDRVKIEFGNALDPIKMTDDDGTTFVIMPTRL